MNANPDIRSVKELLELRKANMLYANPEYQRGVVWTLAQKKRLVDSVLRGYPIPLIYLHHIKKTVAKITNENFEVIDGQQRITALYDYSEGNFSLFDPKADEEEAKFPSFIKDMPCEWGGKRFDELDTETQQKLLNMPLAVVLVETDVANEARDLFIRLQAGMPLNSQEKRDAWPGNFTEFVLKVGGKPQLAKYPGHEFFNKIMKAKVHNRGEFRQFAAQMAMLYLTRRETKGERLCDINREAIDTFYYKHLNFDMNSAEAKRFHEILNLLTQLLGDGKRKKIVGHEAMSLVMLVDALVDEYTHSWTAKFAESFDDFKANLAKDTKDRWDRQGEYWVRYGQLARANSDRADVILRRHQFFVEKMYSIIKPKMKDATRIFGPVEREIIYFRDKKQCQECDVEVLWDDSEIHHVEGMLRAARPFSRTARLFTRNVTRKGTNRPPRSRQNGK
jgi:hypothetical protein